MTAYNLTPTGKLTEYRRAGHHWLAGPYKPYETKLLGSAVHDAQCAGRKWAVAESKGMLHLIILKSKQTPKHSAGVALKHFINAR